MPLTYEELKARVTLHLESSQLAITALAREAAMRRELLALVEKWRQMARVKFRDAPYEKNPMGRQLIEHGAMCYFNCSEVLMRVLDASTPPTSATLEEHQTPLPPSD